jgi:formylglycine-generating enzyme required for sulfatase activity
VHVNWDDAVLFCETLTGLERETGRLTASQSYRLPTEAEWEYACRAGTTTAYSFGDDPEQLAEYGWFDENSDYKLHPVAQKKPNPWGLFDMHGNVFEWCADWYDATLAGGDDPVGPAAGSSRVNRGGYWYYGASYCRSAFRHLDGPWLRYDRYAFRVVVLC